MERLTQRLRTGEVLMASEYEEKYTEQEWISVLQDRLAAYEDTHMMPSDVTSMRMDMAIIAALFNGVDVDRMKELTEADRDGRVVVLPCKVGDTVYLIVTKRARNYTPEFRFVKKSRLTFFNMERILQDFGKEAFLTREEAEKALEAMKDE